MEGRLIRIGHAKHRSSGEPTDRNARLGIALMIVATLFFSFQDGVTKTLIQSYSIWELVFVRFCVLLVAVTSFAAFRGELRRMVRSKHIRLHLLRGTVLIIEIALVGLAYRFLGLSEVMTIFHLFPVIGVLMAIVFLNERLAVTTVVALALSLAGLAIAMAPSNALNITGVACALGAAFFYAAYIVMTRFLSVDDGPTTSIFFVCIVGVIAPLIFFSGSFTPIAPEHYKLFAMLCGFNIVAQSSVIVALTYARASLLQPINYMQIVWASLIGFLVFGDLPSLNTVGGGILIVAAGLLLIFVNSKRTSDHDG